MEISHNGSEFKLNVDQPLNLGIRPEKISQSPILFGTVKTIEPLGSENYLHFEINEIPIICRDFSLEPAKTGEVKTFYIIKEDFRVFDGSNGDRIYLS